MTGNLGQIKVRINVLLGSPPRALEGPVPDGSVFAFTTNPPCVPVSSTRSPAITRNLARILSGWVHGSTGHGPPACLKSHPLLGSISHWLPQLSVQSLKLIMSPSLCKFSLIPHILRVNQILTKAFRAL